MNTFQKLGVLTIGLAMLTTVSLPDRQFHKVVEALGRFGEGILGTAMGTKRG